MKIKGMGEKTIEKLNLESINSIYSLSKDYIISELGEKLGTKLYAEIEKSKTTTVDKYITSFGIPLVGKTASEKLAQYTNNIWNINESICKQAGLGEKATHNLIDWILHNKFKYENLPIKTVEGTKQPEATLKVCITGKLKDFASREKAKAYLKDYGIQVVSSVSSNVDYLVCDVEGSSSSSIKKAEKLNLPIVTMNQLLKLI
jgi:DNA ligase (NAD+)